VPGSGSGQAAGSAIIGDGQSILIGAPLADVGANADVGRVYVYPWKSSYAPQEAPLSVVENGAARPGDQFGRALATAGGLAVVGVPFADLSLLDPVDLTTSDVGDVGRADAFLLNNEHVFGDGFE
jgi:hypothetical protein